MRTTNEHLKSKLEESEKFVKNLIEENIEKMESKEPTDIRFVGKFPRECPNFKKCRCLTSEHRSHFWYFEILLIYFKYFFKIKIEVRNHVQLIEPLLMIRLTIQMMKI